VKSIIFSILLTSLFTHAGIFTKNYSKPEIEIGNMLQENIKLWKKKSLKKPSFIDMENIMRSSGCYVSYHRCLYKNKYYKVEALTSNTYPYIDTSKIKKIKKRRRHSKKINTQDLIYSKKQTETHEAKVSNILKPILNTRNSDKGFSKFGLQGPGCYSPKKEGSVPCLPEIKNKHNQKPFPGIIK